MVLHLMGTALIQFYLVDCLFLHNLFDEPHYWLDAGNLTILSSRFQVFEISLMGL